jgi:hypothetical protein
MTVYVLLILAGVAKHVFFGNLFAAHMMPNFCRTQLLALILGSPLIAFAAYQSGNAAAELSGNALVYLAEFLPLPLRSRLGTPASSPVPYRLCWALFSGCCGPSLWHLRSCRWPIRFGICGRS